MASATSGDRTVGEKLTAIKATVGVALAIVGCGTTTIEDAATRYRDHRDPVRYCSEVVQQAREPRHPSSRSAHISRPPSVVRELIVRYPKTARKAELEGQVVMMLLIDTAGAVADAKVTSSAGPVLDAAALEVIRRFQFTPACSETGHPVPVRILYRYTFLLQDSMDAT